MPKYSNISRDNLSQCHPDLQVLFNYIIKYWDCSVLCGYRGEEAQNKAFEDKKSDAKFPESKHNSLPSIAVDVVPYPVNWKDNRKNIEKICCFSGRVLGVAQVFYDNGIMDHKLKWGGHFKNIFDSPHFELIGV